MGSIEVKTCNKCPFFYSNYDPVAGVNAEIGHCNLILLQESSMYEDSTVGMSGDENYLSEITPPDNCPLRGDSVNVKLGVG